MHTEHDNKINGGGDCTALRDELKILLMQLPADDLCELLREYMDKYGIKIHRF